MSFQIRSKVFHVEKVDRQASLVSTTCPGHELQRSQKMIFAFGEPDTQASEFLRSPHHRHFYETDEVAVNARLTCRPEEVECFFDIELAST